MAQNGELIIQISGDGNQYGAFPNGDAVQTLSELYYYIAGHSLYTYTGGDDAPVSQWTAAGEWVSEFAGHEGLESSGGGNFGQINTLNQDWITSYNSGAGGAPSAEDIQYSYPANTTPFYPVASGDFAAQDFDAYVFMASNFEQNFLTPADYLARTLELIDNLDGEGAGKTYYLYAHWPEPALSGSVVDAANLTPAEYSTYRAYTVDTTASGYLRWHIDLAALVSASRPAITLKTIPVGQVMMDLVETEPYMTQTYTDLFGDTSPHGTEACYFLAGLIFFMATYRVDPDLGSYTLPGGVTAVPSYITNNLPAIVSFVRTRLDYYNANGVGVY